VGQKCYRGATSKITAKELEALTSTDDGRTLREDGGLTGRVLAGVRGITILFRYEFKLNGAKHDHRLGSWPKTSLAEIRAARDRIRVTVSEGIDPTAAKKAARYQKSRKPSRPPWSKPSNNARRVSPSKTCSTCG